MKPGNIPLGFLLWLFIRLGSSVALNSSCVPLKISAFNIQIFGRTKASKSEVMSVLANITRQYDIMLIQEIRDSSMTAIFQLLDLVNANATGGDVYAMELSTRTGRSSSKEQYSFFYRVSRVRVIATHQFDDSGSDVFEREPYSVLFQHNCSANVSECEQFWLQAIHTKPDDAVSEINALYLYSFPAARAAFNTSQGMVLGDLNGDCTYVSNTAAMSLNFTLDSDFTFLFNKRVIDTTVSSTFCTYDNFIIHSNLTQFLILGSARVFNFMTFYSLTQDFAEDVSDHYPIELQLALDCSQIPTLQPIAPTIPPRLGNCSTLKISAFNIQIFGRTKAGKSEVMSVLANITRQYDIMLIQEIRDSSMTAIFQLLDLVNANATGGDVYAMELSTRTGRSSSKEQYSFFYRVSRVRVIATHQFDDSGSDVFEREPYSVLFQHNCSANVSECEQFWLQAIHAKPDDAVSEINALYLYSFPAARAAFNTSQGMVLGDLNGDCTYVSNTAAMSLNFTLDSDFTFLFNKGAIDTTVSSTFCTYDNFIIHSNLTQFLILGSARVFNFMTFYSLTQDFAEDVSDHYPIELQLALDCSQIMISPSATSTFSSTLSPATTGTSPTGGGTSLRNSFQLLGWLIACLFLLDILF